AYPDLLHKTKTALIGHARSPAIPASEVKMIKTCLHSLDATYPVVSLDIRVITKTGDLQWQRWKLRYLPDRLDQFAGYHATGLDITELKKLELKVSKSSEDIESLIRERQAEIQDLNKQIYDEITSHEKTHFQLQFTQFAMDAASYMITWITREGRFIYLNRRSQQVLGYEYRDLIAKNFHDILAGIFPFPWDEIWEVIKRERKYMLFTELRTEKGDEIPVEIVFNYLEFKDVPYCCCFIQDITKRKKAEEALRESRQILTEVLNSISMRNFWKDKNSVHPGCNTAFARDAGFEKQEDIVGKDDYAMSRCNQADRYRDDDRAAIESGISKHRNEESQTTPSGEKIPIPTSKIPLRNAQGEIIGVMGTYIDITQRKGTEAVLIENEYHYRFFVENNPVKIFIKDASLAYVACNLSCARDLGISDGVIAGKTDFDFFPRDLAEKYRAEDRVVMESGAAGKNESGSIYHRKDSGIPTLNSPVKEDYGNHDQVSGLHYDIALRKKTGENSRQKTLVQLQLPADDLPKNDDHSRQDRTGRQS
ncbi:MAG: PAS domain S-box protein, partial [Methanomicrobiales archaeon]